MNNEVIIPHFAWTIVWRTYGLRAALRTARKNVSMFWLTDLWRIFMAVIYIEIIMKRDNDDRNCANCEYVLFFFRNGCAQVYGGEWVHWDIQPYDKYHFMNRPRKLSGGLAVAVGRLKWNCCFWFVYRFSLCLPNRQWIVCCVEISWPRTSFFPSLLFVLSIWSGTIPNSIVQYLFIIFYLNIRYYRRHSFFLNIYWHKYSSATDDKRMKK